jgi:hypothetical protein
VGEAAGLGHPGAPSGSPPPGWYADPYGQQRWWDGQRWGFAVPPPSSPSNDRTLAIIANLGCLLGGFVLPLVIYLVAEKKDAFVKHWAREALNFQLTFLVVWFGGFVAFFFGLVASNGSPVALLFFFVLFPAMILNYVWSIMGAIKASRGELWRYPISIRFVSGRN